MFVDFYVSKTLETKPKPARLLQKWRGCHESGAAVVRAIVDDDDDDDE
jgi:hypothetical protein